MSPFTGNAYGAEFRNHELVYDNYMRECLEDVGLLPEEIDGIFADNARLVAEIAGADQKEAKERADWLEREREQTRERVRRHRLLKKARTV